MGWHAGAREFARQVQGGDPRNGGYRLRRPFDSIALSIWEKYMAQLPNRYGSAFPGEFFHSRELNATHSKRFNSIEKLWDILENEQDLPLADWTTPNTLRHLTSVDRLFFRGQTNQGHGLSTSLHRFATSESTQDLSEQLLAGIEKSILDEAKRHGLDKNVTPGALLMILQHHAAPTRLLDVSVKPLEALYFAVERYDARDGRLFIVWLNDQPDVSLVERLDLPWAEHLGQDGRVAKEWTQSVRLVDEPPLDPRMIAQQGRFLVGGIQQATETMNLWYDNQLRITERQAISMLSINFPKVSQREMKTTRWPALAWTIRIPAKWKMELRSRLQEVGITYDSMYPDLTNIQWRAERAGRTWLGN
jgi:hypothetical protein